MAGDVCPWWMGYVLASPLRRLFENPNKIFDGLIQPGMTVLDLGCAMGFFTLPAARMVGAEGRVVAVDLQVKMINSLRRRAKRAKLQERIDLRVCGETDLSIADLADQIDLAYAIHVVHEVPDAASFMTQVFGTVKPGGKLLVVEPKGHVSAEDYAVTVGVAEEAGFTIIDRPDVQRERMTLFEKKAG
jgi:ubiquinone/menaquinone biosynthesis C-methylase UbiE